ncbi:PD-(D/E)XK nuclease family transposase [Zavarzinella formosa]|uniref:PD-(D/E)XK nuclease family transposase n=1 Tax=Zavarzinella formosa TaxID=360055 RepID=UPI0002FCDBEB|nr:PD-(D/E)XK nuclease family transposase [Zavarzinella formosa]
MILGIDPKVDYAFKKLFGSPAHKNLLIHLLNALMVMRLRAPITDIEILNPFSVKVSPEDKLSILDVKARDADGRLYLVEMQVLATDGFPGGACIIGPRDMWNNCIKAKTTANSGRRS